ncbi:MAG: FecR domain-containing protein, partial [Actinomycetota bacterium]
MTVAANLRITDLNDTGSAGITLVDASHGGSLSIPGGDWLLHAQFARHGHDLDLTGADGRHLLLRDYFSHDHLPDLVTDHGAVIAGPLAARLAGPLAPGQYAQAGGETGLSYVGDVSKVTGDATVRHPDGTQASIKSGDPVYQGDVVTTTSGGRVGITFADGAVFSLGGNGRMTIDEMVYDPAAAKGKETVSVVTGSFSFVSGEVAKTGIDAMSVKTPVATIGIRGTTVAGVAAPEGQPNSISLLPNADGSVGQIAVANQAGIQVMSVPGATAQMTSAFVPPPPPIVLPIQQIQQQYGQALQTLPPPPSPQQIQQMQQKQQQLQQQQQDKQGATEKAVQEAKATAAEKAAAEKAATDKAVATDKAAVDKAAADKAAAAEKVVAAEKALEAKMAGEKAEAAAKLAAAKLAAEGAQQGDAMKVTIANTITQILGTNVGQFGMVGPTEAAVAGPMSTGLVAGPQMTTFGPTAPAPTDIAAIINQIGNQVTQVVNQTIQNQVNQYEQQAANQTSKTWTMVAGVSQDIYPTAGINDQIVGSTGQDSAYVMGALGAGDVFYDSTQGDNDCMYVRSGPNVFGVTYVEYVDMSQSTGSNQLAIGSDGTMSIGVSSYSDQI